MAIITSIQAWNKVMPQLMYIPLGREVPAACYLA